MPSEIAREVAREIVPDAWDTELEVIADIIQQAIDAHEAAQWVSVEERLPEVDEFGWSGPHHTWDGSDVDALFYKQPGRGREDFDEGHPWDGWFDRKWSAEAFNPNVTHWRERPAPPEGAS